MKIYTKTGDAGMTGLFGGARVAKSDARVCAYGDVDELNSALGLARSAGLSERVDGLLHQIQNALFNLGAELATAPGREMADSALLLDDRDVETLEAEIDFFSERLPPLRAFILPGGTDAASRLHLARAVCRRAERSLVHLGSVCEVRGTNFLYLNRLSDLLFVLARDANLQAGLEDVPWGTD